MHIAAPVYSGGCQATSPTTCRPVRLLARRSSGRAVDAGEVELLERVLFALHLSGETVPRLDFDDRAGVNRDDRLALRVEGPNVVVTTIFTVISCISSPSVVGF